MSFIQKVEHIYYDRMWSRSARDSLYNLKRASYWGLFLATFPQFIINTGICASYESWVFVGNLLRYVCTPTAVLLFLYTFVPMLYLVRRFLHFWYEEDESEILYKKMVEMHRDDDEEDY